MTPPLIGITASLSRRPSGYEVINTGNSYVQAVRRAGGLPVLVPVTVPLAELHLLLDRLDGLLLTGGGDIDPVFFNAEMSPLVEDVDLTRDDAEISLLRQAVEDKIPFLGICRGIQVINVALGGTLYTDISSQLPGALHHPHVSGHRRDRLTHPIRIQPGSQLHALSEDEETRVNSLHHQGIDRLAGGLTPVAWSPDGLIEAVEMEGHPYGVGVQWHPEELTGHPVMQRLFSSFIQAADGRA